MNEDSNLYQIFIKCWDCHIFDLCKLHNILVANPSQDYFPNNFTKQKVSYLLTVSLLKWVLLQAFTGAVVSQLTLEKYPCFEQLFLQEGKDSIDTKGAALQEDSLKEDRTASETAICVTRWLAGQNMWMGQSTRSNLARLDSSPIRHF